MATADDARKWAKGFEDGIEPDQHFAVMPVRNLRLLIADLRRFADEHDELLKALAILANAVEQDVAIFAGQPHKESALGLAHAAIAKANGQPAETSPQ